MPGENILTYPTMEDVAPYLDLLTDYILWAVEYFTTLQRFHFFVSSLFWYQLTCTTYCCMANHMDIKRRQESFSKCNFRLNFAIYFHALYLFDLFYRARTPFERIDIIYLSALTVQWYLSRRLQAVACGPGYGYPLTVYAYDRPGCGEPSYIAKEPMVQDCEEPSSSKTMNELWIMYVPLHQAEGVRDIDAWERNRIEGK